MLIQINSNNSVHMSERTIQWASDEVEHAMKRFADTLTRVGVQFNDMNGEKGGDFDKYCAIEVRLEGRQPMTVTHKASSFDQALRGAIDKIERVINHDLDKREHKKGRSPFGGEPFVEQNSPHANLDQNL